MPASMMSAPVGSMPKVIGSSMVMVAIRPTPGSTPIRVPMRQPMKHSARFLSDSATAIPSARLLKRSTMELLGAWLANAHHKTLDGRLQRVIGGVQGPKDAHGV